MLEATHNAPKNVDELKELLKDDIKVKVAGIDVDGTLRGKYMHKDKFLSAVATPEGFGFCSSIFAWDIRDRLYKPELSISNQLNGYQDLIAQVDLSTYRRLPWENNAPFFLISFLNPDTKEPLAVDPRSVLSKACERARKDGYVPYAGVELEFYNFKETPQSAKAKDFQGLTTLTEGNQSYSLLRTQPDNDYFLDLFDKSVEFQVPMEVYHTEAGPGVLEAALGVCSAERMGDNALLFKYLAKSIGMKHGVMPSFMAKIWPEWAGTSGHIHISLQDKDGANIFGLSEDEVANGGRKNAAYHDTKFITQEAEWFLAGILEGINDVMPMFVPTINGYKRLTAGEDKYWGSNSVSYAYDYREASVRIISPPSCPPNATRFEVRIGGADINPYYALSAIIQLGMRSIEKNSQLGPPITEYGPEDKKAGKIKMLPTSLEEATRRMVSPESIAREVLGNEFVDHYGATRKHEVKLWNEAVTNWELERYLELV